MKDIINKYSNPRLVQQYSYMWGYGKVYISDKPSKKYYVINPNTNKRVYFGSLNPPYEDWTKHQNEQRKLNYLRRTVNMKGNWKNNPYSPNNLSRRLLWDGDRELVNGGNIIKRFQKFTNTLIHGRDDYSPKVREFIKHHGNEYISSMTIFRKPIKQIETFFNVISMGQFQRELDKTPYDRLFHLGLYINNKYILEKNEVINLTNGSIPHGSETLNISNPPHITINELLNNTKQVMGDNKFYKYNAFHNNCQDFIINVLHSNGIHNNTYDEFIKQDISSIIRKQSTTQRKLINTLTNLGEKVNILTQGRGV